MGWISSWIKHSRLPLHQLFKHVVSNQAIRTKGTCCWNIHRFMIWFPGQPWQYECLSISGTVLPKGYQTGLVQHGLIPAFGRSLVYAKDLPNSREHMATFWIGRYLVATKSLLNPRIWLIFGSYQIFGLICIFGTAKRLPKGCWIHTNLTNWNRCIS